MTTPSSSPSPSEPKDSAGLPPLADATDKIPATSPTPEPPAQPSASSAGVSSGSVAANKMSSFGIGGGVVAAVVVLLFTFGVVGCGGGISDPQDYVLEDTSAVAIANVASIMAAPAIPAQLAGFGSLGFPNISPEDSSAWMGAWETEWADDFPWLWVSIGLEDITTAVLQEDADGRDLGWIFFGEFPFEDIRESLEDAGRKSDTYREFETWGDDIALLEERNAVLVGSFVQDVLKALDTDRGFVDETSVLKQALQKAGEGLAVTATTTCIGNFFQATTNGCEAVLEVVVSGDAENTEISGAYIFSSDRRAESGLEDVEDAIEKHDTYDVDLNEVNADGQFVSYEVSIVGEFVGDTTGSLGGETGPLSYALEDIIYVGMLNVASVLESAEIPAQLVNLAPATLPSIGLDDPEEWKEAWADHWDGWYLGLVGETLSLSDITHVLFQKTEDGELGVLLFGDFAFDEVREFLEGQEWEEDRYRDFELWNDNIALLEDRGLIALSSEKIVKDLLKALDTGEGFLDDSSALKAGIEKAGEGLSITGSEGCGSASFTAQVRSCDVIVQVIKGGDPDTTELSTVYVFSSERRAESGMEDLEEALENQDVFDADIERIEAEGELVTLELTIHE